MVSTIRAATRLIGSSAAVTLAAYAPAVESAATREWIVGCGLLAAYAPAVESAAPREWIVGCGLLAAYAARAGSSLSASLTAALAARSLRAESLLLLRSSADFTAPGPACLVESNDEVEGGDTA